MRIGLALSGGGARGLAHVGVLSVLVDQKIPIACVTGCSAGAILGAVFCAGMSTEQIRESTRFMSWRRLSRQVRSSRGMLSFGRMERWLTMMIGDLDFQDLAIPLALVAMDVDTGKLVVIKDGRLAPAVRASCSIPGLAVPIEIEGRRLVDGGIIDNLPVDALAELGADYTIGIDVFEPHYGRRRGPLGHGLTAVETLVRNAGGGVRRPDFLIAPNLAGRTYIRFSRYKELIALGEMAAKMRMPALLADIEQKKLISQSVPAGNQAPIA